MNKKRYRGVIAFFMSLLLIFTTIPTQYFLSHADSEAFNIQLNFKDDENADTEIEGDTLTWNPNSNNLTTIKYDCNWTNNEGEYSAGELEFIFTRLGITRNSYMIPKSVTVPSGWEYEITTEGVTTITNTGTINMENASDGVFEFNYELNPRQISKIENQELMAAIKINGEFKGYSNKLKFNVNPQLDTFKFKIEGTDASIEKLSLLGDDRDDYYWREYVSSIDVDELKSQAITNFKLSLSIPEGASVQAVNNKLNSVNVIEFDNEDYFYSDGDKSKKIVRYLVKYPKSKFDGSEVEAQAILEGIPIDSTEFIELGSDEDKGKLTEYKIKNEGELFRINSSRAQNSVFSYNSWTRNQFSKFDIYVDTESKYTGEDYDLEIYGDFVDAKMKSGDYTELKKNDVEYLMLTVQDKSYFLDSNNEALSDIVMEIYTESDGEFNLHKTVNIENTKQQINLRKTNKIKMILKDLSGTVNLKPGAILLSGRCNPECLTDISENGHLNFLFALQARNKSGTILNPVSRTSYVGSDSERIAERDINKYNGYVQRSICEIPITNKNVTLVTSSKIQNEEIDAENSKVLVEAYNTYQVGVPGELSKFTYFSILPKGVDYFGDIKYTLNDTGITLLDGTKLTNENITEYLKSNNIVKETIVENYKDSERTKVSVLFDFGSNPILYDAAEDCYSTSSAINITYKLGVSKENFDKYGSEYDYISAFMIEDSGLSYYVNDIKDNGTAKVINNSELWKDLNENNDEEEILEYSKSSFTVTNPSAVQQGLIKTVSKDNVTYVETQIDNPLLLEKNTEYYYKFQLNSVYNDIENIKFYSMLTEDINAGGQFNGFDSEYAKSLGYNVDLYITYNSEPANGLNEDWIKYNPDSCINEDVKGVAVDFNDNVLPVGKNVYVLVRMKSPEEITETKLVANQFNATTTILGYNTEPTSNTTYITFVTENVNLTVDKSTDKKEYKKGETAIFKIRVKNTGDKDLSDILLTESMSGIYKLDAVNTIDGPELKIPQLRAGEQFEFEYHVEIKDGYTGEITNTITAKVLDITVSDIETITVLPSADLSITKTAPQAIYNAGDTINYTIVVTNTGLETLTNVKVIETLDGVFEVTDAKIKTADKIATIPTLGPDENVKLNYKVIAPNVSSKTDLLNTVNAVEEVFNINKSANCTIQIEPVNEVIPVLNSPGLKIKKTANKASAKIGDKIEYTIEIINNGNVPLKEVLIVDTMNIPNYSTEIYGSFQDCPEKETENTLKISLNVGEKKTYTYNYRVPDTLISGDIIKNTVIATEKQYNLSDSSTVDVTIKNDKYKIKLSKTADKKEVKRGSDAVFTIKVKNTGTGTLNNLQILEQLDGEVMEKTDNVTCDGTDLIIAELKPQCTEVIKYKVSTKGIKKDTLVNTVIAIGEEYEIYEEDSASVILKDKVSVIKPKTGDNTPIYVFLYLAGFALIGMIITAILYKREHNNTKTKDVVE